jgi:drug/metabolite transporter (DMT)-like permease
VPSLPEADSAAKDAGLLRETQSSVAGQNYRLGSLYALATSVLLAMQEPFAAVAAKRLSPASYICVTQTALLLSIPILTMPPSSRRDFLALLRDPASYPRLLLLFLIGLSGLFLYNLGLSGANPIVIAGILNLSPFWAAVVAKVVSKKPVPVSLFVFFGCFLFAFIGVLIVVWSQINQAGSLHPMSELMASMRGETWIYAIPIPLLFALDATLLNQWFRKYEESAAVAANFVVSCLTLIPATAFIAIQRGEATITAQTAPAILLLMVGMFTSAALGRVVYQMALTTTDNDNGFVTMFFLSVPAITSLIAWPMSWWIPELHFFADLSFFSGLALIILPLAVFCRRSWR